MKRLWLGIGILTILLSLGLASTIGMAQVCTPISQTLSSAADLVQEGQWAQAAALSKQAKSRWERWRNLTASLTDHEPMEEVDSLFAALDIYAREGDALRFADCCARLSALTDAVGDAQSVYWWSIL